MMGHKSTSSGAVRRSGSDGGKLSRRPRNRSAVKRNRVLDVIDLVCFACPPPGSTSHKTTSQFVSSHIECTAMDQIEVTGCPAAGDPRLSACEPHALWLIPAHGGSAWRRR